MFSQHLHPVDETHKPVRLVTLAEEPYGPTETKTLFQIERFDHLAGRLEKSLTMIQLPKIGFV